MKKFLCLPLLTIFLLSHVSAQIYISPATTMTVKSGTSILVDSLVLIPSTSLILGNLSITHNFTPIPGGVAGASINRVYTISPALSFTGMAGLFYTNAELNGNAAAALQIAYNSAGAWTTTTGSIHGANYLSNTITAPSLSRVTAVASGVPLPLVVLDFTALAEGKSVRLDWNVAEAEQTVSFAIERATDGIHFSSIGAVPAVIPAKAHYQLYDKQPVEGVNFYRLLAYNRDGSTLQMQMRKVIFNGGFGSGPELYPQPVRSTLNITLAEDPGSQSGISLTNTDGKLLYSMHCTQRAMKLDMQKFPAGVYMLHYSNGYSVLHYKITKL